MIGKILRSCVAVVVMCAMCTTVLAAEMVDNPRYLDWSKYKPGTFIKMQSTTVAGGQNIKSTITTTLKEVTADKLMLEMKTSMAIPGIPAQETSTMMTEPSKIEKAKIKPTTPEEMPNCKILNKGTEDLKIGDKTYKCNWYEMETEQQGMKMTSKYWTCNDVLGKAVKMEAKMTGTDTSMVLVEFKVVK